MAIRKKPSKRKIRKQAELEAERAMASARKSLKGLVGRDIPLPPTSDNMFK